jgi:hypothetical protein
MHHGFNNKFIIAMGTWLKFQKHQKNINLFILISMIINLYIRRILDIIRNKCKKIFLL